MQVLCLIMPALPSDVYSDIPMGPFRDIKAGNKSNLGISSGKMRKGMRSERQSCQGAGLSSAAGVRCSVAPLAGASLSSDGDILCQSQKLLISPSAPPEGSLPVSEVQES